MAKPVQPTWNFSWVVENKLAAMAWPQTEANLQYIAHQGIKHLVTLSPEMKPPAYLCPELRWTLISIEEFEAPTLDQIKQFIDICEEANKNNESVGIHCRMGRGRTGVMAACYLVKFQGLPPERATTNIRLARPGSVETFQQEKVVLAYHDYLRRTSL